MKTTILLCMTLLWVGCTGSKDESAQVQASCEKLCEKVSGCVDKLGDTAAVPTCDWRETDDIATCQSRCQQQAEASTLAKDCMECLAEDLSCSGTASVRHCDADCEPTDFVTGYDYEGGANYGYWDYFCEE